MLTITIKVIISINDQEKVLQQSNIIGSCLENSKAGRVIVKINTHVHNKELIIKVKNPKGEKKLLLDLQKNLYTNVYNSINSQKVEIIQMPIN